nr:MAG TPA: putative membrane protein [Caudoviricetes sp.]
MTIGAAMLGAFLLLLVGGAITFAILGLVWLLVDHPVALFSVLAAALFILLTIWFYVGGNAT